MATKQTDKSTISFGEGVSDETLIETIDKWMKEARPYHDLMLIQQNKSVRYYLGDQTDRQFVAAFNSDIVYNRVFEATETIVPIVTGSAHQFLCIPGVDDERSIERSRKLQKVLSRKYEDLEVQRHLENVTRDIILKRYGVIKWYWDIYLDDVNIKTIDPRMVLIPKLRTDANDLPYVLEVQEYTKGELLEYFPGVKPDDLVKGQSVTGMNQTTPTDIDQEIYQVVEAWTCEYVVWRQGGTILKKMANPTFDFDGSDRTRAKTKANGKVIQQTYKRYYNYLDRPTIPYVFFNPFTTGDAPVSETSLTEVAIPIQDDINTQKRKIIDNLIRMGNGQVYVDSDALTEEQVDEITSEPGLVLQGKNLASENRIKREAGVQLPSAHFANLTQSIQAFDNVFGTHGSVRGQSNSGTLGGQILDRNQDLSRIEELTRCLNRGVARVADGLTQLMKLYYDEEHVIRILGRDGSIEFIKFTQDDIDDNVIVNVKSGVPVTFDPVARANQAVQLWQLGALDPETLFERLEFPNPQESAQKLAAWKTGNLLLESQLRAAEATTGAAATAGAKAEADGAARDVESSANVIARARESIHGGEGKSPLKNTPKGGQPAAIA